MKTSELKNKIFKFQNILQIKKLQIYFAFN